MNLGDAVQMAAHSTRAYKMLERRFNDNDFSMPVNPAKMWMLGGCGVMAEAIKMVVPQAELMATKEPDGTTQHAFARIDTRLYDAEGETNPDKMRYAWFALKGVKLGNAFLLNDFSWPNDLYRDRRASKFMAGLITHFMNGGY